MTRNSECRRSSFTERRWRKIRNPNLGERGEKLQRKREGRHIRSRRRAQRAAFAQGKGNAGVLRVLKHVMNAMRRELNQKKQEDGGCGRAGEAQSLGLLALHGKLRSISPRSLPKSSSVDDSGLEAPAHGRHR